MKSALLGIVASLLFTVAGLQSHAADWSRFRGPNGSGIADDTPTPTQWDETTNLRWKNTLPGPGSSSPIIVGDKLLVTCYTGYGIDREEPGNIDDLERHLLCYNPKTGDLIWDRAVKATQPEDAYSGFLTEHGYASSTPVSDGNRIFAFYGKSGVVAFDMAGNQIWQTNVGKESGRMLWGSAASPIVYDDLVIVTAAEESQSLVALAKSDGHEVWRAESSSMENTWSTPILIETSSGTELVIAVPGELWGFNPKTGKLKWFSKTYDDNTMCSSVVAQGDVVYVLGGRRGASVAVRAGGKGDVTESHRVWESQLSGGIGSPILYDGNIYSFAGGIANCVSAENKERAFQERFRGGGEGQRPPGPGGQDYASPVLADGKIYVTTRDGTVYVIAAKPEFELLATNSLGPDGSDFNATPTISDGVIYIRSNKYLYCIAEE
jgi:hypothetical protein